MTSLLLDMGLPRRSATDLCEIGLDVVHVGERGLQTAADTKIVEVARVENRIIVTLDRDFSTILALDGQPWPSVIHIRMSGLHRALATSLIQSVLAKLPTAVDTGFIAAVTPGGIHIRRLPL